MILGITNDKEGRVIQRLSVSTKLAIGLPPKGNQNYPTKLDHFVFLRKPADAKRGTDWEQDPELTEHYKGNPRDVEIILLDDELENVFPTRMAWFVTSHLKCWGNGSLATRRIKDHPEGEDWTPCGHGCPDLAEGRCKPSGDLRFMLADFPRLGAVARIHTSSYRSIQQIHSSLQQIQIITGGRLAGIRATLAVRPEKTSWFPEAPSSGSRAIRVLAKSKSVARHCGGHAKNAGCCREWSSSRQLHRDCGGHTALAQCGCFRSFRIGWQLHWHRSQYAEARHSIRFWNSQRDRHGCGNAEPYNGKCFSAGGERRGSQTNTAGGERRGHTGVFRNSGSQPQALGAGCHRDGILAQWHNRHHTEKAFRVS
jgi:hypothetical protein